METVERWMVIRGLGEGGTNGEGGEFQGERTTPQDTRVMDICHYTVSKPAAHNTQSVSSSLWIKRPIVLDRSKMLYFLIRSARALGPALCVWANIYSAERKQKSKLLRNQSSEPGLARLR